MTYTFPNQGTCSRMTMIDLAPDHTIQSIQVMGGCNGNLKGICQLLQGMKAEDAIARMEGTTCGTKTTSCPADPTNQCRRRNKRCCFLTYSAEGEKV